MSKIEWGLTGERLFEGGVEKGVHYPAVVDENKKVTYPKGYAWNGLTAVNESPSGGEATALWADNMKYAEIMSEEQFGATVEAYMYPDSFAACDGSRSMAKGVNVGQQKRTMFGLSYTTKVGSDVEGFDYGYKLHLVYGAKVAPSERSHATINESPEAETMSWTMSTTPVKVPGKDEDGNEFKPTAHIVFDSNKVDSDKMEAIEDILYGTEGEDARLPLPEEIVKIFENTTGSTEEAAG